MKGPLPSVLRPVTVPLSWGFGAVVRGRNRRFDRGRGVTRVPLPVLSVGNLGVGGTGKSPLVRWIATHLRDLGRTPAIALRGYGAKEGIGDEAQEHRDRLGGVEVAVGPDRVAVLGAFLPAHPEVDCVVLDDGFQHRALARDLDIVVIDAQRSPFHDRLLPAGWLRELPPALARADAVVVTHADGVDARLAAAVKSVHGKEPAAWAQHRWRAVTVHESAGGVAGAATPGQPPAAVRAATAPPSGGTAAATDTDAALFHSRPEPCDWLADRRVVTRLGIVRADAVRTMLVAAGATIVHDVPARDHQPFTADELARLASHGSSADAIVMTGKDWVKARHLIDWPRWTVPIVVPDLALEIIEGRGRLTALLNGALQHGRAPGSTHD